MGIALFPRTPRQQTLTVDAKQAQGEEGKKAQKRFIEVFG
jgi:hypothetical protein